MKKLFLLILGVITFTFINAQTYDKTITVFVRDFSEECGQDPGDAAFCLTDEVGYPVKERYTCLYNNNSWKVEPQDLITKDWVINPKYKGQKATLYCSKSAGGAGWVVQKAEFVGVPSAPDNSSNMTERLNKLKLAREGKIPLENDNFKTATCRVYNWEGKLIAVVDNNTIYPVKNGVKMEKEGKLIQNKDEICTDGNQCVKVKVDTDGNANFYKLPNTTEKTATLKIVENRIFRTKKDKGEEIEQNKEFYLFKGNKTQVALVAFISRMGMGH